MTIKKYRLEGYGEAVANEVGNAIDALTQKHKGHLTPRIVIEEARDEGSPLHRFFTWDDAKAADEHRMWEARRLIAKLVVEIVPDASTGPRRTRAMVHVDSEDGPAYVSVSDAMSDETYRTQVLSRALSEANEWRDRYSAYRELAVVFEAIKKVEPKIRRKKGQAA